MQQGSASDLSLLSRRTLESVEAHIETRQAFRPGGLAVTFPGQLWGGQGQPFDLGILIEATPDNVDRLLAAMTEAGLGTATLTDTQGVLAHEITVFKDRVRIDVQTSTPGISLLDAWTRRRTVTYQGQGFFVLSKEDLIASKRAAGRPVDMEDVRLLELPPDWDTSGQGTLAT